MMLARVGIAAALGLLAPACSGTGARPQPSTGMGGPAEGPTADILLLATASRLVRTAPALASLWPGYWPRGQGFIIARPHGDVLLVSEVAPDSGFRPLAGRSVPRALRGRAFVRRGPVAGLYASQVDGGVNVHYRVDGTSVTAVAVKDSIRTTAEVLCHEAFHAFQDGHFTRRPEAGASSPQAGTQAAPELDAMAEVERRILAAALLADNAGARALLRSFLAVRTRRFGAETDSARREELQMERIEGTAQLVGIQGSLLVAGDPGGEAARLVRDILTAVAPETDPYWRTRFRVYGTGAALGLLLDRLGIEWRSELQGGETFDDVLRSALPVATADEAPVAEAALNRFGYQQLLQASPRR
jgi:hypothetical protein